MGQPSSFNPKPQPQAEPLGILCPGCGKPSSRIFDSRPILAGTRRRHECTRCGTRFTTIETIASVLKKRGAR
jgi:transcriptional repressor NrdR